MQPATATTPGIPSDPVTSLDEARAIAQKIQVHMRTNVMGRDDVIELALVALFADGHVLLED